LNSVINTRDSLTEVKEMSKLSPHFASAEFACPHCGKVKVTPKLIKLLEELRKEIGNRPIVITSGYRCIEHNKAVGGHPKSYHTKGLAADIRASGIAPIDLFFEALKLGFSGVGLYDSFVHVDVRPGRKKALWGKLRDGTYASIVHVLKHYLA